MRKYIHAFLVRKGLSNDDVGVERGTVSQEIRPGAGFKPAISLKKSSGDSFKCLKTRDRSIAQLAKMSVDPQIGRSHS